MPTCDDFNKQRRTYLCANASGSCPLHGHDYCGRLLLAGLWLIELGLGLWRNPGGKAEVALDNCLLGLTGRKAVTRVGRIGGSHFQSGLIDMEEWIFDGLLPVERVSKWKDRLGSCVGLLELMLLERLLKLNSTLNRFYVTELR
jgi:hypothetical protein